MEWRQVAENWDAFVAFIVERWPRTDATELLAIGGDRDRFESYMSRTHDLTRTEVREDVEAMLEGRIAPGSSVPGLRYDFLAELAQDD